MVAFVRNPQDLGTQLGLIIKREASTVGHHVHLNRAAVSTLGEEIPRPRSTLNKHLLPQGLEVQRTRNHHHRVAIDGTWKDFRNFPVRVPANPLVDLPRSLDGLTCERHPLDFATVQLLGRSHVLRVQDETVVHEDSIRKLEFVRVAIEVGFVARMGE